MNQLLNDYEGEHSDENGPFEVFWGSNAEFGSKYDFMEHLEPGWYWWSCSPGCLPDSDPQGPYPSSHDAWQAAKDLDMGHGLQDQ